MNAQTISAYAGFATLAGVLIPITATLSGALGRALGNPWTAAALVITGAFILVLAVLLLTGGGDLSWGALQRAKPIELLAGVGIAFYLLTVTYLTPRFGVGNTIMFVLAGQIVSSAMIDHFALFGAPHKPIDFLRAAGLVIMATGVGIAQMAASAAKPATP